MSGVDEGRNPAAANHDADAGVQHSRYEGRDIDRVLFLVFPGLRQIEL
jgi:hypothetical protein